ncbi:MAG: helix-turn-helix domain-containing protein [Lachnospiraceae bacterium]|nr:helix-turn-helix domain-containing protein [Lachnospiraceae bacterium]
MNNNAIIFSEYPDVVSPEDVQHMLHMGRNSVYKLLKEEKIKSIKVGKKYIIPKKSVIRFIDINT